MPPTIIDLIPVPVHGHTLFVANNDLPLVPLRPVCDALEIDFRVQQRKLSTHPTFAPTVVMMTTVGADGKVREMLAMPSDLVMGWLMTIHPDKVAARVRETLIAFQRTAARLLYDAWMAARAGLSFVAAGRTQGDLFDRAAADAWMRHPAVQEALLLRREAQEIGTTAAGKVRGLRARGNALVRRLGLRSANLDALAALAWMPPAPAASQAGLPLLEG